jgi:hypothetical protein
VQQFIIPAGATRLYLGSSDGAGANYNNSGSFSVSVSDTGTTSTAPAPVPAASAPILLATGLLMIVVTGYLLMGRTHAA